MVSTDTSAFVAGSAFRKRLLEYASLFDELRVIIFTDPKCHSEQLAKNCVLEPTRRNGNVRSWLSAVFHARRIIKKDPTDYVITSQEEFGGLIAYLLKKIYRVPWQAQVHSDITSAYFVSHSIKNRLRAWIAWWILPSATCIRVVGARTKKGLEEWGICAPMIVLPIAIDVSRLRAYGEKRSYENPEGYFIFLIVSRLASEKNIDCAVRAFARVHREYPHTQLCIVGDGPERQHLGSCAASLGINDAVLFVGWQEDTSTYFYNAHAYITTSWYEGYGLSTVEAMAAGLPIIMTDVGIAGDLLEHEREGIVVRPGDEEALAIALIRVRGDAHLRARLGHAALRKTLRLPDGDTYLSQFQKSFDLCKN